MLSELERIAFVTAINFRPRASTARCVQFLRRKSRFASQFLQSLSPHFGNIQIPFRIGGQHVRQIELAKTLALLAPGADDFATRIDP